MKFTKAALVASLTALTFAAPACDKKEEPKKDEAKKEEPKKEEAKKEDPPLKESKGDIDVIVVADVDFMQEQFWAREQNFFGETVRIPYTGNADFLMFALDQLSGGRMLLGIGTSGPQVAEGWHGQRFGKQLQRTREYVDVVRQALRRFGDLIRSTESRSSGR